ncbi:Na+/H+ antiporter NhaA [Flavobacterium humi]|uniref:Na(+)/H(+) antiporter NhaA n=1 Tax=Flavobacterium humi TaxID=2562683 RepID=A0A4Z0L4V2_9FLAO|nr:Na+/H+ antiporter NhaA [Flavobacterium humi]TGD56731.1 Na+/H+ antiporter NhaA [Flavobacterium humi]
MKATRLFTSFFESEKAGGIVLLCCTLISIGIANSYWQEDYVALWHYTIGGQSLEHLINDGLMTVFFLMIGLELEREIYIGELSDIKNALLPISGAIGGIMLPAILYYVFNNHTDFENGVGIPMATDIAFAIGILSLLGSKVPTSLKVFLTALAVIDDLGAIIIIALFYSQTIHWGYLGLAFGIFAVLLAMNKFKIYILWPYLIGGVFMWYFMEHSGVHATITGVLLAFAIPFQKGADNSISQQLLHWLHKPVSFVILPIFALANTAIILDFSANETLLPTYALGILLGLVVGKPLGITLFSYLSVQAKAAQLPADLNWKQILGAGILGGIGFTMSIFITLLAFEDETIINNAKLYIILASLLAGIIGLFYLKRVLKDYKSPEADN